jgi:NAD(P)-dependent dehydrogenase (short-subunit alcohol dehydrogenase family)
MAGTTDHAVSRKPAKPGFSGIPDPSLVWTPASADTLSLAGKRVAVVGGTGGLGRALALRLARQAADVTVVGRTLRDQDVAGLRFIAADLSRMRDAARIGVALGELDLDLVVLTTGIIAAPRREVTDEGIERDMAVSFLSRLAVLRELAPSLARAGAARGTRPRVFVMGFPGTGAAGVLGDLNAENSYAAMDVHMNTVAANEALVLDAVLRYPALDVFGLNPGLVKTDIRANYFGAGTWRHRIVEAMIGLFTPTPERYADRIAPLLFAPELDRRSGAMFNGTGRAILPTAALDPARVSALVLEAEALLARAVAS